MIELPPIRIAGRPWFLMLCDGTQTRKIWEGERAATTEDLAAVIAVLPDADKRAVAHEVSSILCDPMASVIDELGAALAESAQKLAAAIERAEKLEIRRREGRQLLHRLIKYVREDRAVTPGSTRLVRLVDDVDDYMKRTNDPNDILRATEPPPPEATCPTCGGNGWFLAPPDDRRAVCDDCHGSGKYPQAVSLGGRPAVTIDLRCESCQGTGRAPRPEPTREGGK